MQHPAAPAPRGLGGGGPREHRIRPVVPPRAYSPGEGGQFDLVQRPGREVRVVLSLRWSPSSRKERDEVPRARGSLDVTRGRRFALSPLDGADPVPTPVLVQTPS
ncbi:hypothetical protein THAOC_07190 [Thalassiosira oceanica]|uniref:Uncharacterized protein n=1 Tax=Thalassiosira oceanica TaxID=159749 RepID=K0SY68_THAOC|nr:hypothetical protein THAOC_07190 [Thalassiosira oceanica]|eukprot:EJK71378.1 hypothetical protein THAOC_07190 [Thalassiosira oceanica]